MTDFNALRLRHSGDPQALDGILQMECRQKCVRKLPDTLSCTDFRFPSTALAEMATSDAVAQFHASLTEGAATVLDMTFGLGIDTFAFARRAKTVTGVEIDPHAAETGRHNAAALGLDNVTIETADSVSWLKESGRSFDVIFIDPARRDKSGRHVSLSQSVPDVTACLPLLREHSKRLIVKCSPMLDVTAVRRELGADTDIIAVGTVRECKELIAVIPGSGRDMAFTVGQPIFQISASDGAAAEFALPTAGDILYEPFPAAMKIAGSKTLTVSELPAKIAPNTNLYVASEPVAAFPGRGFRVISVEEFNKRTIRRLATEHSMLNVATRNFPLSAPELLKRLGVTEGGELRLFGVTDSRNKKHLILTANEPISPAALSAADGISH